MQEPQQGVPLASAEEKKRMLRAAELWYEQVFLSQPEARKVETKELLLLRAQPWLQQKMTADQLASFQSKPEKTQLILAYHFNSRLAAPAMSAATGAAAAPPAPLSSVSLGFEVEALD